MEQFGSWSLSLRKPPKGSSSSKIDQDLEGNPHGSADAVIHLPALSTDSTFETKFQGDILLDLGSSLKFSSTMCC